MNNFIEDYRANGYGIVKGVFTASELAELSNEFDRFKREGAKHPRSYRHQNILYMIREDPLIGRFLQMLQWPSYISEVLEKYRVDFRLLNILEPLIGNDLKQIINELVWKPPGCNQTIFAFHQDCRFRRPASAYRSLATSYVQTGIAIDPHRPENGCMKIYPQSHLLGDLKVNIAGGIMTSEYDENCLTNRALDPAKLVNLILDPGDVALWGPFTLHGSGSNHSTIDRRFYINGYVTASNCDRGEWAFTNGQPCPLGEPVLVQYENLFVRADPHYIEGTPYPFIE